MVDHRFEILRDEIRHTFLAAAALLPTFLEGRLLPEDVLEAMWRKKLNHKNPQIAMKAFELALHYRFGKPINVVVGAEEPPPIKIDISAIPKFRVPVS